MPRVVHFELLADDPDQATKFYSNVFGWDVQKWEGGEQPYWLVSTGEGEPGINGGFMRPYPPLKAPIITIDVPSIDEYISKIEQGGGKIVSPKQEIPGQGWAAYFEDTAGNVVGIYQAAPQQQ